MQRIKELMVKYGKPKKKSNSEIDIRPASGMVGQKNCEGYFPDASGKLVRIENDNDTFDYVGPGTYDPIMPTSLKKVRISNNTSRYQLENTNVRPGPCDYCHQPKETKMLHSLTKKAKERPVSPPLSGTLDHQRWTKDPPADKELPYNKYPLYKGKFKTDLQTKEFMSESTRNLWPKRMITPSPTSHAPQKKPVEYTRDCDQSSCFRSETERFTVLGQNSPSPTDYVIPDLFGKKPSKKFFPPPQNKRPPPEPTPDGATYAPPIINKPNTTRQTPEFRTTMKRFEQKVNDVPPCTKYDIIDNTNKDIYKVSIRPKLQRPDQEWTRTPQWDSPAVGSYNTHCEEKPRHGYISTIGHRPYATQPDHPLAFRTQHSSLMKRSYNSHYAKLTSNYV